MYANLELKNKACTKCKENKAIAEFSKNKNTKDGFHQWCKQCLKVGKQHCYLKNKAHYNLMSKLYFEKNKEVLLKINADWRKNNPDKMNAYIQKYRATEKAKANRRRNNKLRYDSGYRKAWNYIRRRGIEMATPKWVNKKELIEFFKNRPKGYHVDHIVPLRGKTVCGLNVPWNLQYLPASLNLKKSNKLK